MSQFGRISGIRVSLLGEELHGENQMGRGNCRGLEIFYFLYKIGTCL